jgi:hypothetical protein
MMEGESDGERARVRECGERQARRTSIDGENKPKNGGLQVH